MPPIVKIGVWEDGKFISVVLFTGGKPILDAAYKLTQIECAAELTRRTGSHASGVFQNLSIYSKFLEKKNNPGLRLIVSFADSNQKELHHGGIYQAGGWVLFWKIQQQRNDYA